MDEFTADILNAADESTLQDDDDVHDEPHAEVGPELPELPSKSKGFRSRFLNAASIQDKLLEK